MKKTAGVSSRSIAVTNKSDIHCCLFFVSTSALAVTTAVGLLEILTVSNSAESGSFLLTICMLAPESNTNSLSSGFIVDAAGKIHSSEANRMQLCLHFRACKYVWQVSTRLRERIARVLQSPPEICPQISQRRDCADEEVWLVFCSATDLCFLGCFLDGAQLLWIVHVDLVPKLVCSS